MTNVSSLFVISLSLTLSLVIQLFFQGSHSLLPSFPCHLSHSEFLFSFFFLSPFCHFPSLLSSPRPSKPPFWTKLPASVLSPTLFLPPTLSTLLSPFYSFLHPWMSPSISFLPSLFLSISPLFSSFLSFLICTSLTFLAYFFPCSHHSLLFSLSTIILIRLLLFLISLSLLLCLSLCV